MTDLMNLPRSIMPAEFFELVRELAKDEPAPEGATEDRASIHLDGAGGGSWSFGFSAGAMVLEEGGAAAALVQVSSRVSDWRELVAGRVRDAVKDHVDASLFDPRSLGHLYAQADKAQMLRGFSGDLRVVLEDREANTDYSATVTLGGGPPQVDAPTTTISVALADLGRLASGTESVQQAFFAGKVRIEGDMNLAMALMTAMMP